MSVRSSRNQSIHSYHSPRSTHMDRGSVLLGMDRGSVLQGSVLNHGQAASKQPERPDAKAAAAADAKALEQLDDGIRSQVSTMFMGRAENDLLSLESLYDIVRELALPFEPDQVGTHVTDDEARSLTLDRCLIIIGRLIEMVHKTKNEQNQEAAVVVTQAAQPIVYLDTFEYIKFLLPGSQRDENTDYRWQRPSFDVRPRVVLLVCVSTMLVLSAFILTLILILLSIGVADDTQKEEMKTIGVSVDHVGDVLVSGSDQVAVENYLRDSSQGGRGVLELVGSVRESLMTQGLQFLTQYANHSVDKGYNERIQRDTVLLKGRMSQMQAVFGSYGTRTTLEVATDRLAADDTQHGFLVYGVNYTYSSVTCTAAQIRASPCISASVNKTSSSVQEGWGKQCGRSANLRWVSGKIDRLNLTVCIYAKSSYDKILRENSFKTVATSFNNATSRSTLSTLSFEIVATNTAGGFTTYGGRNRLPTYCNANFPECANRTDLYTRALAVPQGTTASGKMVGDGLQNWLASYATVNLTDYSFVVSTVITVDALLSSLRGQLTSVFNTNAYQKAASTLMAYADNLGNPHLLYSDPTISLSSYVTTALSYAAQGLDGSLKGDDADRILYYHSISDLNLGILSKMSNSQESAVIISLITDVAATLQKRVPAGWNVFVFRMSPFTGDSEIVSTLSRQCNPCFRHEAADEAFASKQNGVRKCKDIYGDRVVAEYWYFATSPPMVVVVQQDIDDLNSKVVRIQWVSAVVAIAITIVALLLLVLLTQRVLNRIEGDYNHYKFHIEEEKRKFGDLVKDVMPPGIAQKIMRGTRLIAETHPQLTFFFSDMVGSTETSKTMSNKQLVRMLGYTFMLEDEIASHFNIHKIKTIGDAYFAVSGLEDASGSGQSQGKNHQTYRMVSFACLCQQLFGPEYSHFPERTDCFKVSAGGQDLGPMKMVRLRMGIHTGPAVAGVVDVGRAPHFDCFGPSVNLASRMESTATAGRVQISGPSMEILSRLDKDGLFEFENPRKTLVKGYGTMVTYMIKSTNLKVPTEILNRLGIERASRRLMFQNHQQQMLLQTQAAQNAIPHNDKDSDDDSRPPISKHERSSPVTMDQQQRSPSQLPHPVGLVTTPQRGSTMERTMPMMDHGMRPSAPVANTVSDAFVYGGFDVALPPPPPDF